MDGPLTPPLRTPRHVPRSALVWGVAGGLALAAHAAVALLALRPAPSLPPGPPGPPAVLIDLAPLPSSAAAADQDRFGPDAIDAPDIPAPPEPETRAAPVETATALPPAPQTPALADRAAAPPVVPPPPEPAPEPRPVPRPVELSRRPPMETPRPEPPRPQTVRPQTVRPQAARSERPPSQAATATRLRAARPAETSAAPSGGGGGATANEISRWTAQVMARLHSRMVYPSAESAAGRGGTAVVWIFFTPDGTVRSARLKQSSGNRAVDAAALSAVRKASPLPKPPPGAPLDLGAPFTFDP